MRRDARVDQNQKAIVDDLKAIGATVQHLHAQGQGCPDILVGWEGENFLMEIKMSSGKLNRKQEGWHSWWKGQKSVVHNIDEALKVLGVTWDV